MLCSRYVLITAWTEAQPYGALQYNSALVFQILLLNRPAIWTVSEVQRDSDPK